MKVNLAKFAQSSEALSVLRVCMCVDVKSMEMCGEWHHGTTTPGVGVNNEDFETSGKVSFLTLRKLRHRSQRQFQYSQHQRRCGCVRYDLEKMTIFTTPQN